MAKQTKPLIAPRASTQYIPSTTPQTNVTANLLSQLALPAVTQFGGTSYQNYSDPGEIAVPGSGGGGGGGFLGGLAPIISDPQQYAQDFVTATTTGNPLDWGREAIYYTDPTSQALQAVGEPGAANAYTNTANTLGELTALYAAGSALAGGEGGAATAAGGGLAETTGPVMAEGYVAPAVASGGVGGAEAALGGAALAGATGVGGGGGSSTVDPNTLGALIQGGTSLIAGQQGVNAAQDATAELRRQFDIGQTNMAPWLQAGQSALTAQQELMGLGPTGPEGQLSALMSAPGYQFRLGQGQRALEASSAARGGMGSGKAGTAMEQFGQDYASNEYGNRLNQLAGLSGTGQSQAQYGAGLGMNYAGNIGNASIAGANARQSGILGAGSALSNWMNPQPRQNTLSDLWRYQ